MTSQQAIISITQAASKREWNVFFFDNDDERKRGGGGGGGVAEVVISNERGYERVFVKCAQKIVNSSQVYHIVYFTFQLIKETPPDGDKFSKTVEVSTSNTRCC